jgi:hypothetical protein
LLIAVREHAVESFLVNLAVGEDIGALEDCHLPGRDGVDLWNLSLVRYPRKELLGHGVWIQFGVVISLDLR